MSLQLEILRGQPTEAEIAALTAAVWAWQQKQQNTSAPEPASPSAWQRAGLLNTTALGGWPLNGSTWECSERLAQPWQS